MLSDRLAQAQDVTLRSVCGFDEPVTLLFISMTPQRGLSPRYRACRMLPMLASDVVAALETGGFHPLRVCTLNDSSPLLTPHATLLPRSSPDATGGRHLNRKHATCLNHLRFYLAELPPLQRSKRAILLDDDIAVRRPLAVLSATEMPPGSLVAASCDAFRWSRPCIGWAVSRENYSEWFARSEHGMAPSDWAPLASAMASAGLGPPNGGHRVWNFGCALLQLAAHRRQRVASAFEHVAHRLLSDSTLRVDTLLYGLGVAYLLYQGRVDCLHPSRWIQLDGLGHIPHHELADLVGEQRVANAAVVHYTGERKPWSPHAFHEYDRLLPREARRPPPGPLTLVLIVHDGSSADVALNVTKAAFQDDANGCGSFVTFRDRRLEHHPDALLPYGKRQCVRLNRTSKSKASGWCSGAGTIDACHRSFVALGGRPCVWSGGSCTKGVLLGADGPMDAPRCPPPTTGRALGLRGRRASAAGYALPMTEDRISHFDARLKTSRDWVDARAALASLDARIVYLHDDDTSNDADAAETYERLVSAFPPHARISRRRCWADLAACRRDLASGLGITLRGERPTLPSDAL